MQTVSNEKLPNYVDEYMVSKITGIKVSTLRDQRFRRKGLPFIKIGRLVRYDLDVIIEIFKKNTVKCD